MSGNLSTIHDERLTKRVSYGTLHPLEGHDRNPAGPRLWASHSPKSGDSLPSTRGDRPVGPDTGGSNWSCRIRAAAVSDTTRNAVFDSPITDSRARSQHASPRTRDRHRPGWTGVGRQHRLGSPPRHA